MLVFEWNFLGLSSETKPLNNEKVINGSTFYECDTSNFFIYYNGEWYKQTFVTDDGINVYLYKLLMRKMFKNAFDTNISKTHIYNPEISSNISFTTVLPSNITEMEMYGDTYQQTYSGKNLLNIPDGTFSQNGITWTRSGNIANGSGVSTNDYCDLFNDTACSFPAGTYTFTIQNPISQKITLYLREANNTRHSYNINAGSTSVTFTTNYDAVKQHVTLAGFSSGDTISVSLALQLENGSTATSFEPFVGGIPAPNPTYPQPVQTVTGEQTVTINEEQVYTIDLGTTELCKLGDYQDYIYKDTDGWYVHKAIGKITYTGDSSENWDYSGTSSGPFRINIPNSKYHTSNDVAPLVYCDYYTPIKWTEISSTTYAVTAFNNNVLPFRNKDITSLNAWKAWLGSHNMTVYYPFATSTDTKITDTELISSLNSIMSYTFPAGINSITVSASNLPALLKLTIIEKE